MNGKGLMREADGCLFTNHKPQDYNFFKWITQHLQVKRFSASNFAIIAWRFASSAFFLFFLTKTQKKFIMYRDLRQMAINFVADLTTSRGFLLIELVTNSAHIP